MMVDNTENNEFRELLSDYAAPVGDDGFSEHVLMQAHAPRNTGAIKNTQILVMKQFVLSSLELPHF